MDIFTNQQQLTIPGHLDLNLFENAIQSYEKDSNAKVHDFSISPGSSPGDHFGSKIFRVKIKFTSKNKKEEEITTIVKTIEENISLGGLSIFEMFKNVFAIENELYTKILPEIENLLGESFWPR